MWNEFYGNDPGFVIWSIRCRCLGNLLSLGSCELRNFPRHLDNRFVSQWESICAFSFRIISSLNLLQKEYFRLIIIFRICLFPFVLAEAHSETICFYYLALHYYSLILAGSTDWNDDFSSSDTELTTSCRTSNSNLDFSNFYIQIFYLLSFNWTFFFLSLPIHHIFWSFSTWDVLPRGATSVTFSCVRTQLHCSVLFFISSGKENCCLSLIWCSAVRIYSQSIYKAVHCKMQAAFEPSWVTWLLSRQREVWGAVSKLPLPDVT